MGVNLPCPAFPKAAPGSLASPVRHPAGLPIHSALGRPISGGLFFVEHDS